MLYSNSNLFKANETIATLYSGISPKQTITIYGNACARFGKLEPCLVIIGTDGSIKISPNGLSTTNFGELYIDAVYPVRWF